MESSIRPEEVYSAESLPQSIQSGSRVINVASLEGPALSQSMPSAALKGISLLRPARLLNQPTRSRSLAELKNRHTKALGCSSEGEARLLPSCLPHSRRQPLSGTKSCASSLELSTEDSDGFVKQTSLDSQQSELSDDVASAELSKRDNSDSSIIPDRVSGLSLDTTSTGDLESTMLSLENSVTSVKSLSEFESVVDSSFDSTKAVDAIVNDDTRVSPSKARSRNISEYDNLDPYSVSSDPEAVNPLFSEKSECLQMYQCVETLSTTEKVSQSEDITESVFGAQGRTTNTHGLPTGMLDIYNRKQTKFSDYSLDQMASASLNDDDDDDQMKVSWTSSSLKARYSPSSEEFSDEVFLPDGDTESCSTEEFQTCFSVTVTSFESELPVLHICQNSSKSKEMDLNSQSSQIVKLTDFNRDKYLLSPSKLYKPCPDTCNDSPHVKLGTEDCEYVSDGDGPKLGCDVSDDRSKGETCQSTTKPASADQTDRFYNVSQSSSLSSPQTQRTLTVYTEPDPPKVSSSSMSEVSEQTLQQKGHNAESNQPKKETCIHQTPVASSMNDLLFEQDKTGTDFSCAPGSVTESQVTPQNVGHESSQTDAGVQSNVLVTDKPNEQAVANNEYRQSVNGTRSGDVCIISQRQQCSLTDTSPPAEDDYKVSTQEKDISPGTENSWFSPSDKEVQSEPETSLKKSLSSNELTGSEWKSQLPSVKDNEDTRQERKTDESPSGPIQLKRSSRVDYLLNNELFKKHLAGHIDLVEKNILKVRKLGLKKSFSNLDLSTKDSEMMKEAVESSLKLHDDNNTDDASEEDGNNISQTQNGLDSTVRKRSGQNTNTDSKINRRISLACDDPSLQQLHDIFKENKQSAPVPRRGRMHIPSFDEFRQRKQREQRQSSRNSTNSQRPADLEVSNDSHGALTFFRPLDTITEDETADASKSSCLNVEPSEVKKQKEDEDKNSNESPRIVDLSICDKSQTETKTENTLVEIVGREEAITQTQNLSGEKEHSAQLCTEVNALGEFNNSADATGSISNSYHNQHKIHQSNSEKETHQPTHDQSETISSSCSSKVEDNLEQTTMLNDRCTENETEKQPTLYSTKMTDEQSFSDHCSDKSPDSKSPDSDDVAKSAHLVSSSGEMVSSADSVVEAFRDDDGGSVVTTSITDFPFQLFEEAAVSLDTESWARLFMQVHKPRRRRAWMSRRENRRKQESGEEQKPPLGAVSRWSSDVTGLWRNEPGRQGQRTRRPRKDRPYKSDPMAGGMGAIFSPGCLPGTDGACSRAEQQHSLLEGSEETIHGSQTSSFPSLEELTEESSSESSEEEDMDELGGDQEEEATGTRKRMYRKRLSDLSITSGDSGVPGPDLCTSPQQIPEMPSGGVLVSASAHDHQPSHMPIFHCHQCGPDEEEEGRDEGGTAGEERGRPQLCEQCLQRRQERKETIYEIIDTEISYGRDLRILKEEFYIPMQTTGLLTDEQLDSVFINLDELLTVNIQLTEKLRAALHHAANTADHELSEVNIGNLFIESSSLFLAFENYCLHQAQASAALEHLERERELLKIFLQVSQAENGLLRRMHLKSFLMVPVQRIMKYPLLLNRLYKATPSRHGDKEDIGQAREKIEEILSHINAKAKESGSLRTKRKHSVYRRYSLTEKTEVNRVGLEVLGWCQTDARDLITSRLWYAQPSDHSWNSKKCRNLKFSLVHAVLLTYRVQNGNNNISNNDNSNNNNVDMSQQAAVVLVREKNGKYHAVRDPFLLEKSVVTVDPDCEDVFELQEWGREAYVFKAEDPKDTRLWVQHLRQQTHNLGRWRRRRNALPNIMLKNL